MVERVVEHLGSGNLAAMEGSPPLVRDFARFEAWLKSNWSVVRWRFLDWRETDSPQFEFEIEWGRDIGWDNGLITGFIPETGMTIHFRDNSSEYFTLEFLRKLVLDFPDVRDHMMIFNQYAEMVRYEDGLPDDELLKRIRLLEPDQALMDSVWGDA